jgi:predicted nucleotidyltransferase
MTKESIIEALTNYMFLAKNKYPIASLGLFGSFATNTNTTNSDIDILVDFNNEIGWAYFDLTDEIKQLFKSYKVDVVSKKAIPKNYWEAIKNEVVYA